MKANYKLGEEEKMELYKAFYKKMLDEGYTPEYIGLELAILAHALFTSIEH
jgi:hypothetical protein